MSVTRMFSLATFLSICFTLTLLGCRKTDIKEYTLDYLFSKGHSYSDSSVLATLCHYDGSPWDSVLIIKPYTNVSNVKTLKKLKNFSSVESAIGSIKYDDQHCYLLFIKNNKSTGYGKIVRGSFDLFNFPNQEGNIGIVSRLDCEKVK